MSNHWTPNDDLRLRDALMAGIDGERLLAGEEVGPPYTGREWDCAAASAMATATLRAPFHRRRAVLVKMVLGFLHDGFWQAGGEDEVL